MGILSKLLTPRFMGVYSTLMFMSLLLAAISFIMWLAVSPLWILGFAGGMAGATLFARLEDRCCYGTPSQPKHEPDVEPIMESNETPRMTPRMGDPVRAEREGD